MNLNDKNKRLWEILEIWGNTSNTINTPPILSNTLIKHSQIVA